MAINVFDNNTIINTSNAGTVTVENGGMDIVMTCNGSSPSSNVSFLCEIATPNLTELGVEFRRQQIGAWYNNDYSDADFYLTFFPNTPASNISSSTASWNYNRYITPPNGMFLVHFKKRGDDGGQPLITSSGIAVSNIIQNPPLEPYDGTNLIKIRLTKFTDTVTLLEVVNDKGELYASAQLSYPLSSISVLTLGVAHHNYNNSSTERLNDFKFYSVVPSGRVTGTVFAGDNKTPYFANIYVHDQQTGDIIKVGATESNTGQFSFDLPSLNTVFLRVVDPSGLYNTVIYDNVVPLNIE